MMLVRVAWLCWLLAMALFFGGFKTPVLILLLVGGGFLLTAVSIIHTLFFHRR